MVETGSLAAFSYLYLGRLRFEMKQGTRQAGLEQLKVDMEWLHVPQECPLCSKEGMKMESRPLGRVRRASDRFPLDHPPHPELCRMLRRYQRQPTTMGYLGPREESWARWMTRQTRQFLMFQRHYLFVVSLDG